MGIRRPRFSSIGTQTPYMRLSPSRVSATRRHFIRPTPSRHNKPATIAPNAQITTTETSVNRVDLSPKRKPHNRFWSIVHETANSLRNHSNMPPIERATRTNTALCMSPSSPHSAFALFRYFSSIAGTWSGVTWPWTSSSIITTGARPQVPRQRAASRREHAVLAGLAPGDAQLVHELLRDAVGPFHVAGRAEADVDDEPARAAAGGRNDRSWPRRPPWPPAPAAVGPRRPDVLGAEIAVLRLHPVQHGDELALRLRLAGGTRR